MIRNKRRGCAAIEEETGFSVFLPFFFAIVIKFECTWSISSQMGIMHRCWNRDRLRTTSIRMAKLKRKAAIMSMTSSRGIEQYPIGQLLNFITRESDFVMEDMIQSWSRCTHASRRELFVSTQKKLCNTYMAAWEHRKKSYCDGCVICWSTTVPASTFFVAWPS